jgi:hypothetical protein
MLQLLLEISLHTRIVKLCQRTGSSYLVRVRAFELHFSHQILINCHFCLNYLIIWFPKKNMWDYLVYYCAVVILISLLVDIYTCRCRFIATILPHYPISVDGRNPCWPSDSDSIFVKNWRVYFTVDADGVDKMRIKNKIRAKDASTIECRVSLASLIQSPNFTQFDTIWLLFLYFKSYRCWWEKKLT